MSHTPGPWTIEYETEGGEPYDDGVRIDSPEGPVAFNVIDCSAHLIAAAPELLDALKSLFADWVTLVGEDLKEQSDDVALLWRCCEDAIAKAEGRADE